MITFLDFPIHILLHIRDYVFLPDIHLIHEQCDGEKYEDPGLELTRSRLPDWIEICTPKDWRSFVNTNKTDFIEIKKKTVYYDVNKFLCSKLLSVDPTLYQVPSTHLDCIKNLPVANSSEQAAFMVGFNIRSVPPIFALKPAGEANTTTNTTAEISQIPFPFERLTIAINSVGDLKKPAISLRKFPFVKYLTIWNRDGYSGNPKQVLQVLVDPSMQLHSFNTNFRCEFISDQNTVGAPTTLFQHLTRGRMPLVGGLPENMVGMLQQVDLSYSKALVDVSSLRHVHSLSLRGCEKVEDVSMLGEVYSLNISDCPGIVSIGSLGKVKKLSIIGLTELREGLPAESEVKELWVDAVTYGKAGVSEFQDRDKRINLLHIIGKLIFTADQPMLEVREGRLVFDPESYVHLPFSKLSVCYFDLRDNCDLIAMRELVLDSCKLPSMFTPMKFPQLRRLLLLRCEGVQEIVFDHLPGLKVLKIDGCGELKNLTIEHDMDVLELFRKAEVETVTIGGVVNRLVIRGCMSLKLLDVLGEVRESDLTGLSDCRVSFHHKF